MFKLLRNPAERPAIEQRAALLAGRQINYTLKRSSKRRSIGLRIDDGGLTVSVPFRASEKWLNSVLQEKAHWVVEKLDDWQSRLPQEISWCDGETIPHLGELLRLKVVQSMFAAPALQQRNQLWVFVPSSNEAELVERSVTLWYREEAQKLFAGRVAHYAAQMDVTPRALKLSSAKTQWGCCMADGTVTLNVQLVKLPMQLVDYVVVHELAHLREMNHSPAFWSIVAEACPNYVKLRNELKAVAVR